MIHLNYPVDDPRAQSDAQIEADARTALGIGEHPLQVHKITRWSVEAVIASAFRAGRVLLLGDAAHRHPPHRRARLDQRDPRRAEPVLEARRRARGQRIAVIARLLRSRA